MASVVNTFYVYLGQYTDNENIGFLVEQFIDQLNDCNYLSIKVGTNVIHGSFIVPVALGFSTPLHVLGQNHRIILEFCRDPKEPTDALSQAFHKWKQYGYATHVVRV